MADRARRAWRDVAVDVAWVASSAVFGALLLILNTGVSGRALTKQGIAFKLGTKVTAAKATAK